MHGTSRRSVSERRLGKPTAGALPARGAARPGRLRPWPGRGQQPGSPVWRLQRLTLLVSAGVGRGWDGQSPDALFHYGPPSALGYPSNPTGNLHQDIGTEKEDREMLMGADSHKDPPTPLLDKASPSFPQGCNERSGGPKNSSPAPGTSTHTRGFQLCSSSAYAETFGREQRVLLLEFPAD